MRTVYLLRSLRNPNRTYAGITRNLRARLNAHNAGLSLHTANYRPWELVVAIHFPDTKAGYAFEQYLKSGSGQAFARRHFFRQPGSTPTLKFRNGTLDQP